MCETNAFILDGGVEVMLLESLARVEVNGDDITLTGVFGDREKVRARIREINFQRGRVVMERLEG